MIGASFTEYNESNTIKATAWYNNEAYHTAPLSLAFIDNTVLNYLTDDNYMLQFINHPLPISHHQRVRFTHNSLRCVENLTGRPVLFH